MDQNQSRVKRRTGIWEGWGSPSAMICKQGVSDVKMRSGLVRVIARAVTWMCMRNALSATNNRTTQAVVVGLDAAA